MSKGLDALDNIINHINEVAWQEVFEPLVNENKHIIEKELKALNILIKWYQPDIIHDLCCFGASDEEISLVKEILNEH